MLLAFLLLFAALVQLPLPYHCTWNSMCEFFTVLVHTIVQGQRRLPSYTETSETVRTGVGVELSAYRLLEEMSPMHPTPSTLNPKH